MIAPSPAEPIGMVAGSGRLPFLVADGISKAGGKVVMVALRGWASPRLMALADAFKWSGPARMGRHISFFRAHGVRHAVLIGGVRKSDMYLRFRLLRYLPDVRTARLVFQKCRKDRRDNALLRAVAEEYRKEGIMLVAGVDYCPEHLAAEGRMTRRSLPASLVADVEFGWKIARASAELDIGQCVAVKDRDIIAVEAMEGTDAMIGRAGELCRTGGWVLVKVARPCQDMRWDVPTIGPKTIQNLRNNGCACVVVEAGRTIIADKPVTLALADRLGVAVVGKTAGE